MGFTMRAVHPRESSILLDHTAVVKHPTENIPYVQFTVVVWSSLNSQVSKPKGTTLEMSCIPN